MAFTKVAAAGINTTDSFVFNDINTTGVITATSFSGPLTGNVTGNLTGTATTATSLSGTPNITVGAVTADSLTVSGNVSIAGTLTYDDVTNVDSIGIITARSDVLVGGNLNVTGVITSTGGIQGIGIQSAGVNVATGVITALNFVGTGNTFAVNGNTIDISISGGAGSEFVSSAGISAVVDGTPGSNDMPGRLVFSTARDGTSSPVEWLRLDSSGRFSAYGRLNGNNYYGSVGTYADAHTVCRAFGVESTSTAWADQKSALFVYGSYGAGGNNQVPCASLSVINWSSGATNPGAIMRGWKGDPSLTEGTPVLQFQVNHNGNVTNANNSYGSLSDIRYKQDITLADSQWEDIKNIPVKKFRFIDDVKNETEENPAPYLLGCIAQEVAEVSPGLVEVRGDDKDEDGNVIPEVLTLKYSVLYMKAIKALQEAQERIESLETQNATQASAIEALTARLDAAGL